MQFIYVGIYFPWTGKTQRKSGTCGGWDCPQMFVARSGKLLLAMNWTLHMVSSFKELSLLYTRFAVSAFHCISCHLIITLTCMKMLFCYLAENIITTFTATKYPFYWFFFFYFFFFSQHQEEKKIKWKICHRCCFVLAFSFQLYFSTIFSLFYSLAESQKLLIMKHFLFSFFRLVWNLSKSGRRSHKIDSRIEGGTWLSRKWV